MKIIKYKELESTHKYLIQSVKNGDCTLPLAIVSDNQNGGIGSRGDSWESLEGNLFLSYAFKIEELPKDLPLGAVSIYFSYILKMVLEELGSKVWVKWPNDFYIERKKIGGMITHIHKNIVVWSVGLNLHSSPLDFGVLDINVDRDELIEKFFKKLEIKILWKQIFSKFSVEFHSNRGFTFNSNGVRKSLSDAKLLYDGSISINGEKVYNLR